MYKKKINHGTSWMRNEVFKNLVLFFTVNRSYEKLLRKLPKFKMVSKRASVIQLYTLSQSYNYTNFHSHTTIHTSTVIQLYTLPQSVLSRICFHIILPWYWTCHLSTAGLGEFRIRDLNDEINKLLREKRHWEDRIKELGGPDYGVSRLSVLFFSFAVKA